MEYLSLSGLILFYTEIPIFPKFTSGKIAKYSGRSTTSDKAEYLTNNFHLLNLKQIKENFPKSLINGKANLEFLLNDTASIQINQLNNQIIPLPINPLIYTTLGLGSFVISSFIPKENYMLRGIFAGGGASLALLGFAEMSLRYFGS